jgi:hypothetical protein
MVSMLARGQEFSFQMYFEDALGNRDTLTIGYDPNGSRDSILPDFGEENISHIPFDSVFDVRISNQSDFNTEGFVLLHSKIKVIQLDCTQSYHWYQLLPYTNIIIHALHWPVKATWDSSNFLNDCIKGTLFTSWHPSGWWDYGGSYSNFEAIELISDSQIIFLQNYPDNWDVNTVDNFTHYIDDTGKPISIFFLAFGDSTLIKMKTEKLIDLYYLELSPNPTSGRLYIHSDIYSLDNFTLYLFDMMGKEYPISAESNFIEIGFLPSGTYVLIFWAPHGNFLSKKIIKE